MSRKIQEISYEICDLLFEGVWKRASATAAIPYLNAMTELDTLDEMYHQDSARSIVLYFLSNATSWRGDAARRIKAELREMLKEHIG
jgi:hypothetical protein